MNTLALASVCRWFSIPPVIRETLPVECVCFQGVSRVYVVYRIYLSES